MSSDPATSDPLIAAGDDDATVARSPERTGETPDDSRVVADPAPAAINTPVGSSLVVPVKGGSSVGQMYHYPSEDAHRGSVTGTAYFMKPMPKKHGSSVGELPAVAVPDVATQLWRKLAVEADEDSQLSEPVRLEHFEVHRIIGRGGMGAVFLAKDTRLNRRVALKILAPEHTASQSSMDRFRNEARAAAKLDHENIARVHYLGGQFSQELASQISSPALPFIAFEFVEGTNVRQLIREHGAFNAEDAIRIAIQLANALRHTAACGVVHRDVKPSNVIITPAGRAKLVDLGLARTDDPDASRDLTVAGTTLGTFDYISPEQAKDPRTADIRSDIYSLGCTLFHMVVGSPPYPEGTMLQKLLDHQDRIIPDAHSMKRQVPIELSDLIKRMMDPVVTQRPQSAEELLAELGAVATALGIRSSGGGELVLVARGTHVPDGGWRRYLGWVISASIIVMIAVFADQIGGASRLTRSSSITQPVVEGDEALKLSATPDDLPGGTASAGTTKASTAPPISRPISTPAAEPLASEGATTDDTTPMESVTSPNQKRGPSGNAGDPGQLVINVPETPAVIHPYNVVFEGQTTSHTSLSEAIKQAADGALIEVTQGGVIDGEEQFTRIERKTVVLRAAKELKTRPLIRIVRPRSTSAVVDRFFQLRDGGSLRIEGIDLEIIVTPDGSNNTWNIFSLVEDTTVRFRDSSITVRNPGGVDVCILNTSAGMDNDRGLVAVTVLFDNCLVRGNTSLIRSDGICPMEAEINGSAFALASPLLDIRSSDMPMADPTASPLTMHISSSTWTGTSNLISLVAERGMNLADVYVDAHNCIFASLVPESPLVMLSGSWYSEDLAALLNWNGGDNFHSGEVAWQVDAADGAGRPLTMEEWSAKRINPSLSTEATITPAIAAERDFPSTSLINLQPKDFAPVADELTNSYRKASNLDAVGVPSTSQLPSPISTDR